MKKFSSKFLSLLLSLLLVAAIVPMGMVTAGAASGDQVKAQIKSTYNTALSRSGRSSFDGYCATYVNWQLVILGINTSYVSGNGNDEFDNYKNKAQSTGGYSVAAYSASNYTVESALNAITNNGTKDAYNILVGFEKGVGDAGAIYGHTCFIHAILNGNVYYSESSAWTIGGERISEGTPIVQSIANFSYSYRSSNYTFDGIIHFGGTSPTSVTYSDIASATYYLRNKSTSTYLNVTGTASKANVSVAALASNAQQRFVVSGTNKSYALQTSFDSSLWINPASDNPSNGTNINVYPGSGELRSDMHWKFESVSGGYIIHNATYANLVLGLDGTNVRLETNTGASDQIWELVPLSTVVHITLNANGGTPGTRDFYYKAGTHKFYSDSACTNEITVITPPTREGYRFDHYYGDGTGGGEANERYIYGADTPTITAGTFAWDLPDDITRDATLYAKWTPTYHLDLNGEVDGENSDYFPGYADVYINGVLDSTCESDCWKELPVGATYEIKNIVAKEGYTYDGVASGSLTGTISEETAIRLRFHKNADPVPAVGENDPQAVVESRSARPGETVTLTAVLKNADPVRSIGAAAVAYDASALTLTGVEWVVDNALMKTWDANKGQGAMTFGSVADANGALLTLTFAVGEDAAEGDYAVGLSVSVNDGGGNAALPVVAGILTVRSYVSGDLDGDDAVTDEDAIYLLMYTFFPDDYPVEQPVDYDGDGEITDEDAIWLLMYTFFPDDYPID